MNRVLTETHIIKESNPHYKMLDKYCILSNKLYNAAQKLMIENFVNHKLHENKFVEQQLRDTGIYCEYKNMPDARTARNVIKQLEREWSNYFKSLRRYKNNKQDMLSKPNMPSLKDENSKNMIQTGVTLKCLNEIHFPRCFNGLVLKTKCTYKTNFVKINLAKIYSLHKIIKIDVVYTIDVNTDVDELPNIGGIDLGICNFVTFVSNNSSFNPIIIGGGKINSINQYYNKNKSKLQSEADSSNLENYNASKLINLSRNRKFKIDDYLHKVSRFIVNTCIKYNIGKLVIGRNKFWKQRINISKSFNQTFEYIPYSKLIDMIKYKCELSNIKVYLVNEDYTSGTSFLDNEYPNRENYNLGRRFHRGLFISNTGKIINSDVNGAYQIIKKAFPNAYTDSYGIEAVALQPIKLTI